MRGFLSRVAASLASLVLMALIVSSIPVKAQSSDEAFNLVTSPLPINLAAKPGTTLKTDIRVKNGSNHAEQLKVSLMKFSAFGDEGKPGIVDREAGDDYFDWVSFEPSTFTAPPNEWITVKMTIKLPSSAAFGYYYAAVFSRAGETQQPEGKQNVIVGSTAVLVLVDAQVPNAKREASIASFTVDKGSFEFLPAKFSIKVRNSGNVHLIPTGNIFITRGGKTISTISVNSAAGNILPDTNRIFTTDWNEGFPVYIDKEAGGKVLLDEAGKPIKSLKWDLTKLSSLRIGRYTAHLLLAYDNGSSDVPLEATISFWVIPWRLIGAILVITVLVGIGVWSIVRNLYKKVRRNKARRI
jgi:hypothetical protein